MTKYILIFYHLYTARIGKDLSLPVLNQFFELSGSLCFFLLHILALNLVVSKFSFSGWSISELWILLFTFETFSYAAFALFWRGFIWTVRDIHSGAFDLLYTKPIPSVFLSFFRGGGFHNTFCTILGLILISLSLMYFQMPVSPFNILYFLLLLAVSLWIFYNLGVVFISLNFKYGRLESTSEFPFMVQEAYKYPSTAYSGFSPLIWLVFSTLSLFTTFPAAVLLNKPLESKLIILYFTAAILLTLAARFFWNRGLRHYSSASS